MTDTLLGHLALRFASSPENLATEALAYLLEDSPGVKEAFGKLLKSIDDKTPMDLVFRTQVTSEDSTIPDLVGAAADGKEHLLLESKFWAGLTDHQPVSYLNRLVDEPGRTLLFIAPETRLETLWAELVRRCTEAELPLHFTDSTGDRHHAMLGTRNLVLTSWRSLLGYLARESALSGDPATTNNIDQLQGLCDRMDVDAFLPLGGEELAPSIGRRIVQYSDITESVVARLVSDGLASTDGLRRSSGPGWTGRYFRIAGFALLLQFSAAYWASLRETPLWLGVWRTNQDGNWTWAEHEAVRSKLRDLDNQYPSRLLKGENGYVVPMNLPLGVERDRLEDELHSQISEIINLLSSQD